ncbi:MAG: trehalase family glycosidase [Oscillospiraceae bacterium]
MMLTLWKKELDEIQLKEKVEILNRNIKEHGIARLGGENLFISTADLLTGYSYGEFYDWDLYFENIYLSYFGISKFCRNNVEAFLDRQLACGFVARTLAEPRQRQQFKPFLAQTVLLGYKQGQNILWLRDKYYQRLKKYLDYWFWFSDFDKNGLPVWESADHTGMDNQDLRAGAIGSQYCEGVDLACYLYRELKAMEQLANLLGETTDSKDFAERAEALKQKVNTLLWDEADSFYYDRNERTGALIKCKSASSFTPLWAGISTDEQAKLLIEKHLVNPEEFWLDFPLASWAKNEVGYYQQRKSTECTWMGACWVPINYMVMHGLMNYGYTELADELAVKTYRMVFDEADVREYYNAETGIGQGLNPFWGWSSLAYFMPFEQGKRYDPTALDTVPLVPIGTEALHLSF